MISFNERMYYLCWRQAFSTSPNMASSGRRKILVSINYLRHRCLVIRGPKKILMMTFLVTNVVSILLV